MLSAFSANSAVCSVGDLECRMKRFLIAAALLPIALAGRQTAKPAADAVTVQLLAINDFHGNLEPPSGSNGVVNAIPAGGAPYLATHLKHAVAQNPNSIIVSAGDVIGASPLTSSLSHDEATIEAMNAMHLAISSVGNHEFDRGVPELLRMQGGGCHPVEGCQGSERFGGARFEYLAANVTTTATGKTLFPATAIRTIAGVRIGFIGETLRGTPRMVSPAATRGLAFLDEADTANAQAAQLKRQGAEVIVLLLHEGGRQRPAAGAADPNGCDNLGGGIEAIVGRLARDITVVISGHSHSFYNCRFEDHLVTSAGSFGRLITRIDLTVDRASGRLTGVTATNEIVTRDVAVDPDVSAIVKKYGALAETKAQTVVGAVTAAIVRRGNAAGESPLGDVVSDALLDASRAAADGGAVVAFTNTGGIRADIAAGAAGVTFRDLFAVRPFGNVVTVVTMTGDVLKRLLEQQFGGSAPDSRNILQASNGFTYRYRSSAPAGEHVDAESIMINGRRVAPTDRIRVACDDFLADGGSGFTTFREGTDRVVGIVDVDAVVAYFKAHSPVAPGTADRIVRVD
jgi:5'-nucleotidase